MDGDILMGPRSVEEVLAHSPERVKAVYSARAKLDDGADAAIARARIPLHPVENAWLSRVCGSESHQGIVAILAPRQSETFPELVERMGTQSKSLLVALDSIEDPQNLGSILRSSEFFGADAVIWSRNRGVGLTPSVRKSSAGASELLSLVQVANLSDSLLKLKEAGCWVISTELSEDAAPLTEFSFPERSVVVMGAEGEGVSRRVSEISDFKVVIPRVGRVQSLNVSQATAVILAAYRSRFPAVSDPS